jgi:hypothetical protein
MLERVRHHLALVDRRPRLEVVERFQICRDDPEPVEAPAIERRIFVEERREHAQFRDLDRGQLVPRNGLQPRRPDFPIGGAVRIVMKCLERREPGEASLIGARGGHGMSSPL